jgi:putative glutamine amidotransferase
MAKDLLKIGVSACFFHPDSERNTFKSKTLLYLEESMAKWLMGEGVMPVLIPRPSGSFSFEKLLGEVDGIVLQGGTDVSPQSYHEKPLRPEWAGDVVRDQYEIQLIQIALNMKIPLLGVCRGIQILNVALGGTLYQDIQTQKKDALCHRDAEIYDQLFHDLRFEKGALLEKIYGENEVRINSVHHQGIKDLAPDLIVEARSVSDGMIEAVRLKSPQPFFYGIQWHPEFQADRNPGDSKLLDPVPLLRFFLDEVGKTKI